MRTRIASLDHALMLAIARRRHPVVTGFLRILTVTGEGRSWAVIVILLGLGIRFEFLRFPHREFIFFATLAPGIAWIFVKAMKAFWKRRRPFQVLPDYPALSPAPTDESFPSGHAASVFAFFVATLGLGGPASALIGAWATLVAFSRYYLGVHFPSDIVVGILVGCAAGAGLENIRNAIGAADLYPNYAALAKAEREGQDFQVEVRDRGSEVLVLAIHGGKLEVGSDAVANAIAGTDWSAYLFRIVKDANPRPLHLTSTRFDDPRALALAAKARICVSVHGYREAQRESVCVGGGNAKLRAGTETALRAIFPGFAFDVGCAKIGGVDPANIVNRCREKGVQLELSGRLRDRLLAEPTTLTKFAKAVRDAVSPGKPAN